MMADFDITGIKIETERLILRPFEQTDLQDFYEYAKVDGVGQMAGWMPHENIQTSQVILDDFIGGKKTFALYHKADKKVVGSIGIELRGGDMPEFDNLKGREIGYVLSKDYWGQGLMPEAVKAVIKYLFEVLDYDFLLCGYFSFNKQSSRVQEKCGFTNYRRLKFTTRCNTEEDGYLNILLNPNKKIELNPFHRETLVYKPLVLTAQQMWKKAGFGSDTHYEEWAFGGDDPNHLASLVLKGEKRATTSAFELYEIDKENIPQVGDYSVILNQDNCAVCIIRNTSVTVRKFCEIDETYAKAEGEGDKSLEYWKKVHKEFFTSELAQVGKTLTDDTLLVCEIFELMEIVDL